MRDKATAVLQSHPRPVLLLWIVLLSFSSGCRPYWFEKSNIEKLDNPVEVVGREGSSLVLKNGERVQLAGITQLLPESHTPLLNYALTHGVEVCHKRATGLIRIHHWCGNDPVRTNIARVDLADLAIFTGEGKAVDPKEESGCQARLTEAGWNINQYLVFKQWRNGEKVRFRR